MARPSNIKPAMDTGYLSQQVNTIIGQLHGLFDEIGVPGHERETREAEVCACHADFLISTSPDL